MSQSLERREIVGKLFKEAGAVLLAPITLAQRMRERNIPLKLAALPVAVPTIFGVAGGLLNQSLLVGVAAGVVLWVGEGAILRLPPPWFPSPNE